MRTNTTLPLVSVFFLPFLMAACEARIEPTSPRVEVVERSAPPTVIEKETTIVREKDDKPDVKVDIKTR